MKIKTAFVDPPIPDRQFDYCAWDDNRGEDSTRVAYGRTRAAAIRNLRLVIEDETDEALTIEESSEFDRALRAAEFFEVVADICKPVRV